MFFWILDFLDRDFSWVLDFLDFGFLDFGSRLLIGSSVLPQVLRIKTIMGWSFFIFFGPREMAPVLFGVGKRSGIECD